MSKRWQCNQGEVQFISMPLIRLVPMWLFGAFVVGALFYPSALSMGVPIYTMGDIEVNSTAVATMTTVYLDGSLETQPEMVAACRVRIPGWSRLLHVDKFHHTFRVRIQVPSLADLPKNSKIDVCFDQNPLRALGECEFEGWRSPDKTGNWLGNMSPFQEKLVDIRVSQCFATPSVTISVQDDASAFRLVFLAVGLVLLVVGPLVSGWVPFYYGSAMSLGAIMIILVILYQGMKLLPAGRKSSLYIIFYGFLAGVGSVMVNYVKGKLSSVLWEMGITDDMYKPMAIFAGVGVALLGAWMGYLAVRKLVLAEDGSVDDGVAEFIKWSIRILGSFALSQSSSDYVFVILALFGGSVLSWVILNVRVPILDIWENLKDLWPSEPVISGSWSRKPTKKRFMTQAQMDAVRRLPGTDSVILSRDGLVNYPTDDLTPELKEKTLLNDVFPSTFHQSPGHMPPSKQEYVEISREFSNKAVGDLLRSKEFAEWRLKNKHRVVVEPYEHRKERLVDDIELTAVAGEEAPRRSLFGYKRR